MDERPVDEQMEHDLIVSAAAQQFGSSEKYVVHINPGQEHNCRVNGCYPDLVITDRTSGRVKYLIEIETVSSVDRSEAKQWQDFAGIRAGFYLIVPYRMLPIAEQTARTAGVKCRFGYYVEDEKGKVRIVLKKK